MFEISNAIINIKFEQNLVLIFTFLTVITYKKHFQTKIKNKKKKKEKDVKDN